MPPSILVLRPREENKIKINKEREKENCTIWGISWAHFPKERHNRFWRQMITIILFQLVFISYIFLNLSLKISGCFKHLEKKKGSEMEFRENSFPITIWEMTFKFAVLWQSSCSYFFSLLVALVFLGRSSLCCLPWRGMGSSSPWWQDVVRVTGINGCSSGIRLDFYTEKERWIQVYKKGLFIFIWVFNCPLESIFVNPNCSI